MAQDKPKEPPKGKKQAKKCQNDPKGAKGTQNKKNEPDWDLKQAKRRQNEMQN